MPKAIFCIGISGSGKTTWAHQQKGYYVLDSDQLRLELYGDETCQRDPHKVFDLMYKRGREQLLAGHSVIFCSTNLSMKYRIHAIQQLHNIPDITFHAVVFNTPLDICSFNNKKRERQVPEWLFMKQVKQLQLPVENEGWDSIRVVNCYWQQAYGDKSLVLDGDSHTYRLRIIRVVADFGSQDNCHHSLSLIGHCEACGQAAEKSKADPHIVYAAYVHDYGKAYTATHWKGQKDDGQMHYPNHAEVGAYLTLNMGYSLKTAQLVNYHMLPYMDAAAQKTWRARLGEDLWNDLLCLHKYDELAH